MYDLLRTLTFQNNADFGMLGDLGIPGCRRQAPGGLALVKLHGVTLSHKNMRPLCSELESGMCKTWRNLCTARGGAKSLGVIAQPTCKFMHVYMYMYIT